MRNLLRAAAVVACLVCVPALVAFVASLGGGGGDDESAVSPTAGGFMPWAVATVPPMVAGAIPWASPTASATATASATVSAPTLTPEERAEAETLLRAAALRPEDIPEGFTLESDIFTTNEALVEFGELFAEELAPIGGATLDDLEKSGRILGYFTTYGLEGVEEPTDPTSFSGTAGFQVKVELFRGPGDAKRYFETRSEEYSNPQDSAAWKGMEELYKRAGLEWRDVVISVISFPALGDERIAAELATTLPIPELGVDIEYATQSVAIRRDRTVAEITIEVVNSAPPAGLLEDLARRLDERMKGALE